MLSYVTAGLCLACVNVRLACVELGVMCLECVVLHVLYAVPPVCDLTACRHYRIKTN